MCLDFEYGTQRSVRFGLVLGRLRVDMFVVDVVDSHPIS